MKFTTITCLLACVLSAAGSAMPEPAGKHHGAPAHKPQCGPKVVSLATGIHLNIEGQHAELSGVKKLQKIESGKKVNEKDFLIAKGELLSDIAAGMTIRKYNQAIAPKGNPANPGLAKYAKAQQTEQKLSMSLTGMPKHDKHVLATLVGDIKNGTMLNMMNLKKATEHCSLGFTFPA